MSGRSFDAGYFRWMAGILGRAKGGNLGQELCMYFVHKCGEGGPAAACMLRCLKPRHQFLTKDLGQRRFWRVQQGLGSMQLYLKDMVHAAAAGTAGTLGHRGKS